MVGPVILLTFWLGSNHTVVQEGIFFQQGRIGDLCRIAPLYFSLTVRRNPPPIRPPILALGLLFVSGCLMAAIPLSPIPILAGRGIGVSLLILGFVTTYSGFSAFRNRRELSCLRLPGDVSQRLVSSSCG